MSQWLSLWITVQHRVHFLYVFVCWLWDNTQIRVEYQTRILNIPLSPPSADAHSQVCSVASVAAVMTTSTPVPGYNTHPSVSIMNSIKGWDEAKLPDCVQKRQFFLLYLHQIDDHNFKLFAQDCFYIYASIPAACRDSALPLNTTSTGGENSGHHNQGLNHSQNDCSWLKILDFTTSEDYFGNLCW